MADRPGVARILLIGSVARGETRPSDLDLAVIFDNVEEGMPHASLARRLLSQITTLRTCSSSDRCQERYAGMICSACLCAARPTASN